MENEHNQNELRTFGNKFEHQLELSILCEVFFYKASQLEIDMRYNPKNIINSFKDLIKVFFDMYYRFAEVSNDAVYIAELETALDKHASLDSRDSKEVIPKCKFFLNLARRMRHQLKVDGLYNPEIIMKYQNNPNEAWSGSTGGG